MHSGTQGEEYWSKKLILVLAFLHDMSQADSECIRQLWSGGRLWKTFQSRVTEFAPSQHSRLDGHAVP